MLDKKLEEVLKQLVELNKTKNERSHEANMNMLEELERKLEKKQKNES